MAGMKARRGDEQREQEGAVSWAVEESGPNAAGLRVAQGEGNSSAFSVNVYVVDMILSKLLWSRSCCVCVPLPVRTKLLETEGIGVLSA